MLAKMKENLRLSIVNKNILMNMQNEASAKQH